MVAQTQKLIIMYTLTLVRINLVSKVFENTEFHGILLLGDIEKELAAHNTSFEDVEKVLNLKKGERTTIQVESIDKCWFYYIIKIN